MDKAKVIKWLECCLGSNDCEYEPKEDCPYKGMCLCAMALRFDILALLKEPEPVLSHEDADGVPHCGSCGWVQSWGCNYCDNCGKPLRWE